MTMCFHSRIQKNPETRTMNMYYYTGYKFPINICKLLMYPYLFIYLIMYLNVYFLCSKTLRGRLQLTAPYNYNYIHTKSLQPSNKKSFQGSRGCR